MHIVLCSKNIGRLKLPLSCEVVEKGGFGPAVFGGIPQISDMHFQIALNSEHVGGFG